MREVKEVVVLDRPVPGWEEVLLVNNGREEVLMVILEAVTVEDEYIEERVENWLGSPPDGREDEEEEVKERLDSPPDRREDEDERVEERVDSPLDGREDEDEGAEEGVDNPPDGREDEEDRVDEERVEE